MERGNGNGSGASRLDRNMKERVRRKHMKDLLSELAFLTPLQSSKVWISDKDESSSDSSFLDLR
ncbi:hypothetical protein Patl1_16143 [Pistacia atlantica]|uniref:Uncharacterized protein n=1 Tax=Pistacia atlantica TaxID=434234 RepID=A0ACC1B573_9ROSI|nr:hypothetical protein Patl1_16143 [Pistacia atlantica]